MYFRNYLPLEKTRALHLNKLESPSPKKKKMKMRKVYDNTNENDNNETMTDNRQILIRKAEK